MKFTQERIQELRERVIFMPIEHLPNRDLSDLLTILEQYDTEIHGTNEGEEVNLALILKHGKMD